MRLWLVRHAAVLQAAGVCYGASDVPADAASTAAAAASLALALPDQVQVHCSPLRRCTALAAQLQALRPACTAHIDPRLAEMDFGTWEGRSWDAIGEPALRAWTDDFREHHPGGGESLAQFMARVGSAWREATAANDDVVWITHAGVIKAATWLASGQGELPRADQWPVRAVLCGAWVTLTPAPLRAR